jgi:hypothetical protein
VPEVRIAEWKGKLEAIKRGASRRRRVSRTVPTVSFYQLDLKPISTTSFVTVIIIIP